MEKNFNSIKNKVKHLMPSDDICFADANENKIPVSLFKKWLELNIYLYSIYNKKF